jgi:hypothetical protein
MCVYWIDWILRGTDVFLFGVLTGDVDDVNGRLQSNWN